jgi:hypothetical protein
VQDSLRQLLPYLPILVVVIIMIRRTQRPRIIRPARFWITPAIFLALGGFYALSAVQHGPPVQPVGWLVMAGTAVIGIGLGAVRAHSVKLRVHPDTGAIEATLSAWGLLILLAWIGGRMLLRQSGIVDVSTPFGLYTDATLSLALGLILTQAIVLTRRCQSVVAQYKQSAAPQ